MADKKVLLSGIQPSGALHIGNYFGAIKQWIDLQEEYDTYISIVNYHAMTTSTDGEALRSRTLDTAISLIAAGLNPDKMTLFVQSDIPELTELTWIFNTLVTVPFLSRAVAYKDKVDNGLEANVGLFDYPVLMASDILIMNSDVVPVGADQKQHLEYSRDIAQKFNSTYGETFKLPEGKILGDVGEILGTDGKKMSKSYNNTIPLFASRKEIEKAVMTIVTDSDGGRPENVYAIHKLFRDEGELKKLYEENSGQYKILKETLIEDIDVLLAPMRDKREEIAKDMSAVETILKNGAEKARSRAMLVMHEVRKKTGLK